MIKYKIIQFHVWLEVLVSQGIIYPIIYALVMVKLLYIYGGITNFEIANLRTNYTGITCSQPNDPLVLKWYSQFAIDVWLFVKISFLVIFFAYLSSYYCVGCCFSVTSLRSFSCLFLISCNFSFYFVGWSYHCILLLLVSFWTRMINPKYQVISYFAC